MLDLLTFSGGIGVPKSHSKFLPSRDKGFTRKISTFLWKKVLEKPRFSNNEGPPMDILGFTPAGPFPAC